MGLAKDVVPDILLVCGQLVLDALGVAPLVLPRGHRNGTGRQTPGRTHISIHRLQSPLSTHVLEGDYCIILAVV